MRLFPGLVKFVHAVASHICLNLPAAFSQPENALLSSPVVRCRNVVSVPCFVVPCRCLPIQMAVLCRRQSPPLWRRRRQNTRILLVAISSLFAIGLFSESLEDFTTLNAASDGGGARGKWGDWDGNSVRGCTADDEECTMRYAYVGDGRDINCKQSPLDDVVLSSYEGMRETQMTKHFPLPVADTSLFNLLLL